MKTIILFCIPIILLTILANSNILPNSIYVVLIVIICVIGLVVIWRKIVKAYSHDNMNYQEYVWGNGPPDAPYVDNSNPSGLDPWKGVGLTCVAQECCDSGFTYVPSPTNKCTPNSKLPTGVKPYNPTQAQSVSSTPGSTSSSLFADFGETTRNSITRHASSATRGLTDTATQSVASVYDSLANL